MPDWLTDPAWLGVILTVVLAALGAMVALVRSRRAARPQILFRTITLMTPGRHTRNAYAYAVRWAFENVGGSAYHVVVFLADNEGGDVYAEVVTLPTVRSGERIVDDSGLRLVEQSDDPTHTAATDFLRRAALMIIAKDRLERLWLFAPGIETGGRLSSREVPWGTADPQTFFHRFPSRAAELQALGNPWMSERTR